MLRAGCCSGRHTGQGPTMWSAKPPRAFWATVSRNHCRTVLCQTYNSSTPQLEAVDRRQALFVLTAPAIAALQSVPPAVAKPSARSAGDWSSPGLAASEDESIPKFFKTGSGVKVQNIASGTGEAAQQGDYVLFDYVLRRSNGYFIYGTVEGVSFQPADVPVGPVRYKLGDPQLIQGLQEVLIGMQQGGKRRALIPPDAGYIDCNALQPQPPTFATKRQLVNHCKEPLLFEVQLLRVQRSD